ncbi:hypothetical protein EVAR_9504_1 [Eumeta japonica]|uniref:Uncharacterized protein n=1 Tax=Eumeta variegata TaxID=151549 RepID=A0A4C1U3H5_EUMVA|nr:hypothetical protein EVAR_9504_1 [Eumeta japonica]
MVVYRSELTVLRLSSGCVTTCPLTPKEQVTPEGHTPPSSACLVDFLSSVTSTGGSSSLPKPNNSVSDDYIASPSAAERHTWVPTARDMHYGRLLKRVVSA